VGESHADIVRELFERFAGGGVEHALELLGDDFVLNVPPSMSAEPDVYQGHEGARRYFQGFEGLLEDVRFEPVELLDEPGGVIARLRFTGRGVASGIEVEQFAAVLVRVEDGKVTRMEPYPDLETARAQLRNW
jgi:ketosteroid isomerase-like protein